MQKTKIQAILFDLDGTLVDTIEDITAALNAALSCEDLKPLTTQQCMTVVGRGLRNALSGAMALQNHSVSEERLDSLFAVLNAYYSTHATDHCKPYGGIAALLERLNRKSLPLGVFSNKEDDLTKTIVERMFPKIQFAWVRGMREDFPRKPDSAGLSFFCDIMGIPMESLLYVGDSEVDYQTSMNAGCSHVLVTWGFRSRGELEKIEGVRLIDSVKELEDTCYDLQ